MAAGAEDAGSGVRLGRFAAALEGEGFGTGFVPASSEVPYDNLLVAIDEDSRYRLELAFLPGMEEQLAGMSLLQCFVALRMEVEPGAGGELRRLITTLNTRSPLIGFGYLEPEGIACFRHVLTLPEDAETAVALVVQATWLVSYLVDLFGGGVAEVAAGAACAGEILDTDPFRRYFD